MVKPEVENIEDAELIRQYRKLGDKDEWDAECKFCKLPELVHVHGACTRAAVPTNKEEWEKVHKDWAEFRKRMKGLIKLKQKGEENIEQMGSFMKQRKK